MTEGVVLGHYISVVDIQVDRENIEVIIMLPTPCTPTEVRSFPGYTRYYRRFILHFSNIAAPLYVLIGNVEFEWTEKCDIVFADLKKIVSTAPVLRGPNWIFPFHISSGASDTTIGVILGLEEDKKPYAIYYINKNITPAEFNYTVIEKESLVVVYDINKFLHYITGYLVFMYTNHSSIRYLTNKPITNGQITQWFLLLQEFNITIKDLLGKESLVEYFLSRVPKIIDSSLLDDQFPDEYLFSITLKTPWYADVANYLATGKLPMHLSPRDRKCSTLCMIFLDRGISLPHEI